MRKKINSRMENRLKLLKIKQEKVKQPCDESIDLTKVLLTNINVIVPKIFIIIFSFKYST